MDTRRVKKTVQYKDRKEGLHLQAAILQRKPKLTEVSQATGGLRKGWKALLSLMIHL